MAKITTRALTGTGPHDTEASMSPSVEAERAFDAFALETTRRRVMMLSLLFAGVFSAALLVRLLLAPGGEGAASEIALLPVQAVLCLGCWAALRYVPALRPHPIPVAALAYTGVAWAGGSLLSNLGGLDSPAFYGLYTLPSLPIALPTPLRRRLLITSALVLPFLGAYFLPHPEYLNHPLVHIPMIYVAAILVAAVVSGHWIYGLTRDRFVFARQIEAQRELLAHHNLHLSREVEEKSSQVRQLADRIETVRVDVRSDLARTLHDDLGQLVVGARMELGNLEKMLASRVPQEAEELRFLNEIVESLAHSTRRIVRELREEPTNVSPDVSTRIEALMAPIRERSGVQVTTEVALDSVPDAALCPKTRETIYRAVQEGMTNVLKHAHATRADVIVRDGGADGVWVEVRDDGVGFDGADTSDGFGLRGLRERADALGGQLDVRSGPDGSRLRLTLPVAR